jgi:hypothetical protein
MTWIERNQGLQSNPWWLTGTILPNEVVAVYQPKGAESIAISYTNLVNGLLPAAPGVAPTWDFDNGWTFNGTTQYLITEIVPTGDYTILVRFKPRLSPNVTGTLIGETASNANFRLAMTSSLIVPGTIRITYNWLRGANNVTNNSLTYAVASVDEILMVLAATKPYMTNASGVLVTSVSAITDSFTGTALPLYIGAHNNGGSPADFFNHSIQAIAIYDRQLTQTEVDTVRGQVFGDNIIGSDAALNVNYITQNPRTKHLNSTSHELLIATDGGIFRTYNGGRSWSKITLPDPSNSEFADSPAATVDELTFHWIAYDPLDLNTLYVMATKTSVSRVWIYKSTNSGDSWTSRGVDWT